MGLGPWPMLLVKQLLCHVAEAVTWRAGLPPSSQCSYMQKKTSGPFRQSELYRTIAKNPYRRISCKNQAHRDTVPLCSGEGVGWYYFFGVLFYSG